MRAREPRVDLRPLPPPFTRGDVPYGGSSGRQHQAPLPGEADLATLVLGSLHSALDELQAIRRELEGPSGGGEADVNDVTAQTGLTVLADARRNRIGLYVFNDATTTLRLKLGAGAAPDSFSVKVLPGQLYELPQPAQGVPYRGLVTGVWDGAPTGSAYVTEFV